MASANATLSPSPTLLQSRPRCILASVTDRTGDSDVVVLAKSSGRKRDSPLAPVVSGLFWWSLRLDPDWIPLQKGDFISHTLGQNPVSVFTMDAFPVYVGILLHPLIAVRAPHTPVKCHTTGFNVEMQQQHHTEPDITSD